MKTKIIFSMFILTLSTLVQAKTSTEQYSVECKTLGSSEDTLTIMKFDYDQTNGVLTETKSSDALHEMTYQGESLTSASVADHSVTQTEKGVILKLLIITGDPSKLPILLRVEKLKNQCAPIGTISYGIFEQKGVLDRIPVQCSFIPK